jgi:hypothetical protein
MLAGIQIAAATYFPRSVNGDASHQRRTEVKLTLALLGQSESRV